MKKNQIVRLAPILLVDVEKAEAAIPDDNFDASSGHDGCLPGVGVGQAASPARSRFSFSVCRSCRSKAPSMFSRSDAMRKRTGPGAPPRWRSCAIFTVVSVKRACNSASGVSEMRASPSSPAFPAAAILSGSPSPISARPIANYMRACTQGNRNVMNAGVECCPLLREI